MGIVTPRMVLIPRPLDLCEAEEADAAYVAMTRFRDRDRFLPNHPQ